MRCPNCKEKLEVPEYATSNVDTYRERCTVTTLCCSSMVILYPINSFTVEPYTGNATADDWGVEPGPSVIQVGDAFAVGRFKVEIEEYEDGLALAIWDNGLWRRMRVSKKTTYDEARNYVAEAILGQYNSTLEACKEILKTCANTSNS